MNCPLQLTSFYFWLNRIVQNQDITAACFLLLVFFLL